MSLSDLVRFSLKYTLPSVCGVWRSFRLKERTFWQSPADLAVTRIGLGRSSARRGSPSLSARAIPADAWGDARGPESKFPTCSVVLPPATSGSPLMRNVVAVSRRRSRSSTVFEREGKTSACTVSTDVHAHCVWRFPVVLPYPLGK